MNNVLHFIVKIVKDNNQMNLVKKYLNVFILYSNLKEYSK